MMLPHFYTPDLLIEPVEICNIMGRAGTQDDAERATAVAAEYIRRNGSFVLLNGAIPNNKWHWMWMLATVYQAGKIQAFREVRAKKKEKAG